MMQGTAAVTDDGDAQFVLKKSLRFNNPDNPYLTRTPINAGNRRTFTIAAWVRRNRSHDGVFEVFTVAQGGTSDPRDEMILWHLDRVKTSQNISSGSWQECKVDNTAYRDAAAWYHIMVAYDTTQSEGADRVKMYVNGKLQTFSSTAFPTHYQELTVMNVWQHSWGRYEAGDAGHFDGAMTACYLIDGLALNPGAFGKFDASGNFNPIDFLGQPAPNDGSTWSGMVTAGSGGFRSGYAATRLFDGKKNTSCQDNSNSVGNNITFTPTTPIPYNCSVEVYSYGTPSHEYHWENEDGTKGTTHGNTESWHKVIIGSGKLKSLKIQCQSAAYIEPSIIRVDGVVLIDGKVDGSRSTSPNNDRTWSDNVPTGDGFRSGAGAEKGFNGKLDDYTALDNTTFALPVGNWNLTGKMEVMSGSNHQYSVDGSTAANMPDSQWKYVGNAEDITTLTLTRTDGAYPLIFGIKIDGYILLDDADDNGCCLQYDDGKYLGKDTLHGRLDNATGGLPILNTKTDDHNPIDCGSAVDTGYRADSSAGTTDGSGLVLAIPGNSLGPRYCERLYATNSTGIDSSYPAKNAFDDTLSTFCRTGTNGHMKFEPESSIAFTKLRIHANNDISGNSYTNVWKVNGTDVTSAINTGAQTSLAWVDVTSSVSSPLTSIEVLSGGSGASGGSNPRFAAIEINDVVLRDYGELDVHHNINTGSSQVKVIQTGDVEIDTRHDNAQPLFYGGCIRFDGSNDYLKIPESNDFKFGAGSSGSNSNDFTIEVWIRPLAVTGNRAIFGARGQGGSNALLMMANAELQFNWPSHDPGIRYAGLGNKKWYHVAVTRKEDKVRMFVNGEEVGKVTSTSSVDFEDNASFWYIGYPNYGSGTSLTYFYGHMADIRMYKGVCKYDKSFTAPWRNDFLAYNVAGQATADTSYIDGTSIVQSTLNYTDYFQYIFDDNDYAAYVDRPNGNYIGFSNLPTGLTQVLTWAESGQLTYKFDGGSRTDIPHQPGGDSQMKEWKTIGTGKLVELGCYNGNASHGFNIYGIKVNGVRLLQYPGELCDRLSDSPSNSGTDTGLGAEVSGNYAGFGDKTKHSDITIKNNRREAHGPTAGHTRNARIEWPMTSGKWYWEIESTRTGSNNGGQQVGICTDEYDTRSTSYPGQTSYTWAINGNDGDLHHNGGVVITDYCLVGGTSNGTVMTTGNTCMCAYDADTGKFWMGMNGTWGNNSGTGNPATGANPGVSSGLSGKQIFPIVSTGTDSGANHITLNPGDRPFRHTAPTGFKALCTANLEDTFTGANVNNPSKFFDIVRWKGYGNNADRTISGTQFQPDLIWAKGEDTTYYHQIYDAAYGFGNDHSWASNANTGRGYGQGGTYGWYESNSKGITLRQGSGTDLYVDESGKAYIAWLWDCGAAAATASTAGDVTPSAQWVNNEAGFSITNWAGNDTNPYTVGHGLSVKPNFIIIKRYSTGSSSNFIYHSSLGAEKYMQFDATGSVGDDAGFMNDTEPDNEKFTLGNWNGWDAGENIFAYCFANIPGYFKAGSYVGNATSNNNGPIIDLGFRPRMIIFKNSATSNGWRMMDTHANGDTSLGQAGAPQGNSVIQGMYPHLTNGYDSPANWNTDYLCNGVNVRDTNAEMNGSGNEVIYMAWAEQPFKTARAR